MAIKVTVRNVGGENKDSAHIANVTADQYVSDIVASGFVGNARKTVECLESGFPVVVDQFDIIIEQQDI